MKEWLGWFSLQTLILCNALIFLASKLPEKY